MKRRMKATIAYDGTNFSGYQVQPQQRTVQEEIEKVLTVMHKSDEIVHVTASGRTDARVHATGQVLHFDTTLSIPLDRYAHALNVQLPRDIRVLNVEEVAPDFHARFSVHGKRYRYIWSCESVQSPFRRFYATPTNGVKPDVSAMKEAAQYILGTHDFSAFCAANTGVKDKVRTVEAIEFEWHGEELHMTVEGNGFLYNMVRIIAGTLWEVGTGKRISTELEGIVASMDRSKAGKTASAQGLYLEKVYYPE
ncbi:tRNA pseudouridine synthase A [Kurthia zopfii]|uniref:tRNA pseudouridine synthase A n=1 Tax=Kurthia zopfii TaxID=1650 RepID=A0A2U3ACC3_9BACL|nr:tRNA pseudouridine(38-40) synthase TruA [Kurthia zopfii]PWI22189.1 tRNA pseudouridine(38-40) synthase TruA [Kurthia zopfii]TDR37071.1 tRNA pseudouridine(38-40) synthase [Kurthia zopfii]STX11105.1 tRNA pseudouridine synthase A [Kurthia zopfii]VEI05539.1 tRNA pseudouridine synthase A [Kurthia zopfii]GEK30758.1 tRNA pseudouridine synthase A [Kurthia zopfii]